MNNLRSTPTGGNGGNGGNNNDRPRLTDAEKKQNHIISEQKRRLAIRQGFDRLASLVPGMQGQGRSEALVLNNGVDAIKYQTALKAKLKKRIMSAHPDMSEVEFEQHYDQFLVGAFVTANGTGVTANAIAGAAAANNAGGSTRSSSRTNSPNVSSDGDYKGKGKGKLKQEGQ